MKTRFNDARKAYNNNTACTVANKHVKEQKILNKWSKYKCRFNKER